MVSPASRKRQRRQSLTDESGGDFQNGSDYSSEEPEFEKRGSSKPTRSKPANSAKNESKPKHRFHIVKNVSHTNDGFLSQIPESSQGLHHIRGALWRKSPSRPPSPPLPVLDISHARTHSEPHECPADLDATRSHSHKARQPQHGSRNSGTERGRDTSGISLNYDGGEDAALLEELADFPLDMLSSPAEPLMGSRPDDSDCLAAAEKSNPIRRRNVISKGDKTPEPTLRQMTLFGGRAERDESDTQASQRNHVHNWPLANSGEATTHHELDNDALQTWVYPTNLGAVRDYQYNIVARGLFSNLLVALPTGLGKTFIAAAIMLNWFRWTKEAQIVFVAPTRPLVAQQVNACFQVAGIPRSTTSLLTGNVAPGLRAEEWKEKRVFFMTPQTIVNDLKTGIADPERIVLIVVDEAHRATGNYAYVEVVNIIRKFNKSFRVLALTATPGSTIESVQEVIDGLGIARTEIRTEDSIDIRQYVHQRNIDTVVFDYSDDMTFIMDLLSSAIKPVLQKVTSQNILWSKDPMALTAFGCMQARQKWMASPAGRNASFGFKGMVNSILTTLSSIAHAIELLKFHGIGPFYHKILSYQTEDAENGKKGSKYKKEICDSKDFKTMMSTMQGWISKDDFLGHPKLEYLSQVVLNHFIDAGEGRGSQPDVSPSATRVMIFAHFRDSAEEIAKVLKRHSPLVRPHVFVGQANSRLNEGMDQKKQQQIIDSFKDGKYNALIATSIGEEGLDIGQVDLIVCYDASASPIRMLQRMGRTGRKRAGNIVVLLMRKKEEENFEKARDNYEKMQQMIAEGVRFNYRQECSPRIVPRGITPQVDKRTVEIPIENSQADGELPEPRKRGRAPKRPPKKFHMPDGVITGFLKASELGRSTVEAAETQKTSSRPSTPELTVDSGLVFLTEAQEAFLEKHYLDVGGDEVQVVEFPRLDRHTEFQRQDRPSKAIGHSTATWRLIETLNAMHDVEEDCTKQFEDKLTAGDRTDADEALRGRSWPVDNVMARSLSIAASALRTPGKKTPKTPKTRTEGSIPVGRYERQITPPMTSFGGVRGKKRRRQTPQMPPSSVAGTEGEGIDLMNTDDEDELDDDSDGDDGSDLIGFIDDATQVEVPSSSVPLLDSEREGQRGLQEEEDVNEEDDDLFYVSPKTAMKSRRAGSPVRKHRSDGSDAPRYPRPRRGRAVVSDDSDDE